MFDYDEEGHSIVIADGTELLVYDGQTEAPRWRTDVGARLVGVASNAISVLSLDVTGELKVWSHETATEVRSFALGVPATGLVSEFEGRAGALHAGGVVAVNAGEPRAHDVEGASAAAFGGEELVIGTEAGALHVFGEDGAFVGRAEVPGPVHSITWCAGGFFFVANGRSVHRLDGLEVAQVTNAPEDEVVRTVACSASGDRLALHLSSHMVVVLDYPSRETVGHAHYADREVVGVAFGPAQWLGVGLDLGDGNKFDLATGATHRTDTHPGRTHNRWILMNGFGPPEPARAPAPAPMPGGTELPPQDSSGMFWLIGAVLVLVAIAAFLISTS